MKNIFLTYLIIFSIASTAFTQNPPPSRNSGVRSYPDPVEGDFMIRDFRFDTGETLAELRLHYRTIGTLKRDASGIVRTAVLILPGTGGSDALLLRQQFASTLFGPGQMLDTTKYFIVLTDNVGHGQSSKPTIGLHARCPHYGYNDMVTLQHRLLTEQLGVNHL